MPAFDTTALLAAIRRHTHIAANHPLGTDAEVLALATETLLSDVVPLLKGERQEFMLSTSLVTARIPLVDSQAEYAIPGRAVGNTVRKATLVDAQGAVQPLRWYEVEEVEEAGSGPPGLPTGFSVQGGRLVLWPLPSAVSGWTLRLPYYVRPGALVTVAESVIVTAPASETMTVPASTMPSSFVTGAAVDVLVPSPPFEVRVADLVIEDVEFGVGPGGDYNNLYFSESPTGALAGDVLALAGTSPFPQIPAELHPLLALWTAVQQLRSLGDAGMATAKQTDLEAKLARASALYKPRNEGEGRKVTNGFNKWRAPVLPARPVR
jgi:hypothetical protein